MLDRSDNEWPALRQNVGKACRFWRRIGKLIRREVGDLQVSAIFYQAVLQSVLLLRVETWFFVGGDVQEAVGVAHGIPRTGDGPEGQAEERRYLEKRGSGEGPKESGNTDFGDVH